MPGLFKPVPTNQFAATGQETAEKLVLTAVLQNKYEVRFFVSNG
jgi:hypothetical protein